MNRKPQRRPSPPMRETNYHRYHYYRPWWPPYYDYWYWDHDYDYDYDYDWGDYYMDESINSQAASAYQQGIKIGRQQALRSMAENGYAKMPVPPEPPVRSDTAGYCGSMGA